MSRVKSVLMNKEANIQYRYKDMEEVKENLGEIIKHHIEYQRPALEIKDDYYQGDNVSIRERKSRKGANKTDNRIAHPFASYISNFMQGYMTGIPIKVTSDDEQMKEMVLKVEDDNDINTLNSEIVLDLSKYGRAYELVHYIKPKVAKTLQLDVMNTFVIYDTTVTGGELCGVYYRLTGDSGYIGAGERNLKVDVTVYTDMEVITLEQTSLKEFSYKVEDTSKHVYGEVPVIEYSVDKDRKGDFEKVIDGIDSYDSAMSDVTNYLTDFNESYLIFKGDLRGVDWDEVLRGLTQSNLLKLQATKDPTGNNKDIDVGYLTREYDHAGVGEHLIRVEDKIFELSNIPNLTDEKFSGNSSGIAIRYKLSNVDQIASKKFRALSKGLNKRYRMITKLFESDAVNLLTKVGNKRLTFTWTPNVPESHEEELRAFIDAGGVLSLTSLLRTLSFIDSPEEEVDRIISEASGATVEDVKEISPEERANLIQKVVGMIMYGKKEEGDIAEV